MKILLAVVLIWTISSCNVYDYKESDKTTAQKEYILPNDWKRTKASDIKFSIPPNLVEKEPRHPMMKGSTAKFYGSENIWLVFTIQSKPNDSMNNEDSKLRDFQVNKTVIDGKQSLITTFTGTEMVNEAEGKNYVAVLDIPQIQGNEKNLLMWAYSKSSEDREIVLKTFKSVQFPKE